MIKFHAMMRATTFSFSARCLPLWFLDAYSRHAASPHLAALISWLIGHIDFTATFLRAFTICHALPSSLYFLNALRMMTWLGYLQPRLISFTLLKRYDVRVSWHTRPTAYGTNSFIYATGLALPGETYSFISDSLANYKQTTFTTPGKTLRFAFISSGVVYWWPYRYDGRDIDDMNECFDDIYSAPYASRLLRVISLFTRFWCTGG